MFPSFKSIVFQFLADWGILIRFEWTYKSLYRVSYSLTRYKGLLRKLLYTMYASNTGNIHVHKYNVRLSE